MLYSIVSALCIVVLSAILIYTVLRIVRKKGAERTKAIRDFKMGQCAIVYLPAIPLYWMGLVHSGEKLLPAFFQAINKVIALVVLSYDTGSVELLMRENPLYSVAIYFCFALVTANAMLFTISLLNQKVWLWMKNQSWKLPCPTKILILGNNEDNIKIYNSEKNAAKVLLDNISDEEGSELFFQKIQYVSTQKISDSANRLISVFLGRINKTECRPAKKADEKMLVIINTHDEEKNIHCCQDIVAGIKNHFSASTKHKISKITQYYSRIQIYVFGDPAYEDIYNDLVESSHGMVRYVNKYRQIAIDFIDKYPLTAFMNERQLDTQSSTVNENVNLNVLMIGFGKANKQIFLTSVANNQFVTRSNGKIRSKLVNYHIFDSHTANNKNLNHNYYRYQNEMRNCSPDDYLPLPEMPSDETYYHLDINASEFYGNIRQIISANSDDLNYIIISFGTDLENIDLAQKILQKKKEWNVPNLYVFVKVRSGNDAFDVFARDDCYLIGNECECVYSIRAINDDKITRMAKMRNRIYALEYEMLNNPDAEYSEQKILQIYESADDDWYIKKTQFERESNIYACLSLRSKLHMMGLDYTEKGKAHEASESIDKQAYLDIYARDDLPTILNDVKIDDKDIISYNTNYLDSRRNLLAVQEHYRWNAFMISKGFIPATKDEILNGARNGKDYSIRKHGNLTTFEGLVEFRQMVARHRHESEQSKDVIRYDYQLMDDAFWLLTQNGNYIHNRHGKE